MRISADVVRPVVRALDRAFFNPVTPLAVQRAATSIGRFAGRSPRGTVFSRAKVDGVPGLWCYPPGVADDAALLFLHGGGYTVGRATTYRHVGAVLAQAAGIPCFIADYRRAPRAPYPAAANAVLAVYQGLLAEGRTAGRILIGGDSAGGGLALGLAMAARDRGLPSPAAVALICPWLDLTRAAERRRAALPRPTVCSAAVLERWAAGYAGHHDPADPRISPLHGDLSGLPPLLLVSADDDVLAEDARQLAARGDAQLTHCHYPRMWHGFYLMNALLPEAEAALHRLGTQLGTHLAPRPQPIDISIVGASHYDLERHLRLNTEVTHAAWDGTRWRLSTTTGSRTADVLVTATGFLHHPAIPQIKGLDLFSGKIFHSSRWDPEAISMARTVAVIGTGASGTQIVSALAGSVDRLLVFQRTPQWIMPIANPSYSRLGHAATRRCRVLQKLARRGHQLPVLWPWSPRRFRQALRSPVLSDFDHIYLKRKTQ